MVTSTLINNLSAEHIDARFDSLQKEIKELKKNFEPKAPTEYLTRNEVATMLKCDISTVHNWTVAGKIISYGIGNRVYFKREEIESALIPLRNNKNI